MSNSLVQASGCLCVRVSPYVAQYPHAIHSATHLPLIEPDVRISRIRLSWTL